LTEEQHAREQERNAHKEAAAPHNLQHVMATLDTLRKKLVDAASARLVAQVSVCWCVCL